MSLALDAMGGDLGPSAIVAGAIEVAPLLRTDLLLVGDQERLKSILPRNLPSNIKLVHAASVVEMTDKPTEAYRKKKDSSLMVCTQLVKEGRAKAMVSAGNTGAAVTFALLTWRQIPGVHRPAIASRMPGRDGGFILLDTGASPDSDPEHLVQFARMGRIYSEKVLGRKDPLVHLLNIGEEPGKGNAFSKAAYLLLEGQPGFAGNIEGKDVWTKPCDVVVCDAFVGNVMIKSCEGIAEYIRQLIKDAVPSSPLLRPLYWPVGPATASLRKEMDYAEYGGSPLLGLNGICVIAHGRSDARAIRNACLTAQTAMEADLVRLLGGDA